MLLSYGSASIWYINLYSALSRNYILILDSDGDDEVSSISPTPPIPSPLTPVSDR